MTEDIWDELVEKYGISGYTDSLIIVKYDTFMNLHEKAELWDDAVKYANSELDKIVDDEEPCVDIGVWCTGLREDLIICSDKLEAVRAWLTYAKAQGYISISKGEQLDKILEGED